MAKKISFEAEVLPGGVDAGLKMIEAKAAAANGRMNRTVYEAQRRGESLNPAQIQARADYRAKEEHRARRRAELAAARSAGAPTDTIPTHVSPGFTTGSGTHQFTAADKMDRFSKFGVASSMFVSVARDSAASLASGAPAFQVIAQQAPQVLQAFTMIGGAIMKWGLGIGAVLGGLYAFHKLSRSVADAWFDAGRGLEGTGRGLERVGKELRKLRAEQAADNEAKAKKIEAENQLQDETYEINHKLSSASAQVREAQAGSPEARQRMVLDRLRTVEQLAAMAAAKSSQFEFIPGRPDLRKKALEDQLALKNATLDRVNAENALADLAPKPKALAISSDALTSVGNFLGAGRGMVESINQQLLAEQRTANRHHDTANKILNKIADKLSTTSGQTIEVPSA